MTGVDRLSSIRLGGMVTSGPMTIGVCYRNRGPFALIWIKAWLGPRSNRTVARDYLAANRPTSTVTA